MTPLESRIADLVIAHVDRALTDLARRLVDGEVQRLIDQEVERRLSLELDAVFVSVEPSREADKELEVLPAPVIKAKAQASPSPVVAKPQAPAPVAAKAASGVTASMLSAKRSNDELYAQVLNLLEFSSEPLSKRSITSACELNDSQWEYVRGRILGDKRVEVVGTTLSRTYHWLKAQAGPGGR